MTKTFMMDFEFHSQKEDPAPQSIDLLLINESGEFAIGFNSEDKGFYYTNATTMEFPKVIYWAYLERIPAIFETQIITNDEWITLAIKNGLLKP